MPGLVPYRAARQHGGVVESSALRQVWRDAHALVADGDLAQARQLLVTVIRDATVDHDPDVLETRRRLAEVHYGLSNLTEARRELELALGAGTESLGEAHPLMLAVSARLGAVADEIGNRYEARRNFGRLARLGPAVLGATHPAVRLAEAYLARAPVPSPAVQPARPAATRRVPARPAATRRAPARRRRALATMAIVGTILVAGVVTALVVRGRPHPAQAAPSAPSQVTVRADHGAVTVTWDDPTAGTAPFIVAGGVAGQPGRLRQQVPAGQTSVTINGLNATLDYCFSVVAVYGTDNVAISDLVCTHRADPQH